MNLCRSTVAIVSVFCAFGSAGAAAPRFDSDHRTAHAKVTIERARLLATRIVAGPIVSQELETEAGGSGLRYTFTIKGRHGMREVGIDAKTGIVLEDTAEDAASIKK